MGESESALSKECTKWLRKKKIEEEVTLHIAAHQDANTDQNTCYALLCAFKGSKKSVEKVLFPASGESFFLKALFKKYAFNFLLFYLTLKVF